MSADVSPLQSEAATLFVSEFHSTPTGFIATFNQTLDAAALNLYDSQSGGLGPADVTVTGNSGGPVSGSLVVEDDTITFVKSGGVLAADTYTVTLRSAANGFKDMSGDLLDGDGNGVAGDDYVNTIVVTPAAPVVVSIADLARGPSQEVNPGTGLAIVLGNGAEVRDVRLVLRYDPSILRITEVQLDDGLPDGSLLESDPGQAGMLALHVHSPTAMGAGVVPLLRLHAQVPGEAPYGKSAVLDLDWLAINGGTTASADDDGVQVVAYFGEVTGNKFYSALDASRILRVAAGVDSGFTAYPTIHPAILADITGNNTLSALDGTRVLQEVAGLDRAEIADIVPAILPTLMQDTGASSSDGVTFDPAVTGTVLDDGTITSFKAGIDIMLPADFMDVTADLLGSSFIFSRARLEEILGGTLPDGFHTLHLQATDNDGNASVADLAFTLDTAAPETGGFTLSANEAAVRFPAMEFFFMEEVDAALLNAAGVHLASPGDDLQLGTPDDIAIAVDSLSLGNSGSLLSVLAAAVLGAGDYRLMLDTSIIADIAGNPIVAPITQDFTIGLTSLLRAASGTAADPQMASANPSQSIGLVVPWDAAATRMTFPVVDSSGFTSSRTIMPWSIDSVANVAFFIVPDDALTGNVTVFDVAVPAVTEIFLLQIVPVIRGLNYSSVSSDGSTAGVTLTGRGFVEGLNTTYRFGTVAIVDSSSSTLPDVNNDFQAVINNGTAFMNVPLTPEAFGPIVVQTAGGTSAPFTVGFTGLTSTALSGTSADGNLASANPGQAVVVTGHGLTTGTDFILRYISSFGQSRAMVVNPVSADLDGARATLIIPNQANSVLPFSALGSSFMPLLQIVPVVNSFDVNATTALLLRGRGFVEGDATYQFTGVAIVDTSAGAGPDVLAGFTDSEAVHLTPPVHTFGALQVTTDGGTSAPLNMNLLTPGYGGMLFGTLRDVAYDSVQDRLWIVPSQGSLLYQIDPATVQTVGVLAFSEAVFGSLNFFGGLQVLTSAMTLHDSSSGMDVAVPAGSLLFVNGAADPDRIVAVTTGGGLIASLTLPVDYQADGIVYDDATGHVFLLSSNQTTVDRIFEIDPLTGDALGSLPVPFDIVAAGGGMTMHPVTGNLWIGTTNLQATNDIAEVVKAGPQAGSVRRVNMALQGINNHEITGLTFLNGNDLAVSSSQGVIYHVDLAATTPVAPPRPVLVAIDGLATDGTPANAALASANVGQVIELFGSNFRMSDLQVQFAARDDAGNSFIVAATPITVSDDGMRALVRVPDQADTGVVSVVALGTQSLSSIGSSDAVHRDITLAFTASGTTAAIHFEDSGLQGASDESWGLDNVRVALSAMPSSFIFLDDFEGGASDLWSSSLTDATRSGTLTQVSGRFSNQVQTLNLSGLIPGQEYQLTFDLFILGSWEGVHPSSGPDFLDVVIDGTLRFHEAFANTVNPRAVQTFGASGNVPLQIVPVLTGTRLFPVVDLMGSGFMEGASTITIGGLSFTDTYTNLSSFDVQGPRNDTYRLGAPLTLDGPIRVSTAGGFHQIPGLTPASTKAVNFTGIQMVIAQSGTPADALVPSVNTGQRIVLEGQGFTYQTEVVFEAADDAGVHGTIMRTGTPSVSGLTLTVEVPALARTGTVRVVGDDEVFPLQIVPLVRATGGIPASGNTVILEGTGLVKDELLVRIDGLPAAVQEFHTISDQRDSSGSPAGDITRHQQLLLLVVPDGISNGVLTVETAGGSSSLQGSSLNGITALALSGTAAVAGAGSANTGQMITLHGVGLNPDDEVVFTNLVRDGYVHVAPQSVAVDGTSLEVIVPSNAITGMVRLLRDTTGVFLQIVPTLTDVDLGTDAPFHNNNGLRLVGTGFADRFMAVHFDGQTITNGRNGGIYVPSNNELTFVVPNGVPPGPIRLSTPGGTSEAFGLTFTGLLATAASGTPADPGIASANPGQTITLQGTGLDMTTDVVFPIVEPNGTQSELVVRPVAIHANGTNITVIVPAAAVTGSVAIAGDQTNSTFLLQIVPIVTSVDVGSISGLTAAVTLTGRGFVEGHRTAYRFGTETFVDRANFTGPDMTGYLAAMAEARTTLNVPLTDGAFGAIVVETAGGSSAPFTIGFSGLTSVAFSGTPANISLPSANPGQAVTATGSGLTAGIDFIVRYIDNAGAARATVVNPVIAALDGSSATLILPEYANGVFPLRAFGSSFIPQLQIVPLLKSFDVNGTNTLRLLGRGFVEGDGSYQVGGQMVIDTAINSGPNVFSGSFDNAGVDFVLPVHVEGALQVFTDGGTSAALNVNLLTPGMGATPVGYLRDAAYDPVNDRLWVVGNTQVQQIDPETAQSLSSFDISVPVFGSTTFQGGIHVLAVGMTLADSSSGMNVAVPAGSLLFVNGVTIPDRVVAVSPDGTLIASLTLGLDVNPEALLYDEATGHVFLLGSSQSPDSIFEIDPLTASVVRSVPVSFDIAGFGGGMTLDPTTGNFWIGSSLTEIAEVVKNGPQAGSVVRRVSVALEGIGFNEVSGLAFRSATELYVSSTLGIVYRVDPAPPPVTSLPAPVLTSINALAVDGTPADAGLSSANIGQVIELTGSNFRLSDLQVQFAVRDNAGVSSITSVAPLAVSDDGTRAQVQVPNLAETGGVRVVAMGSRHLGFNSFTDHYRDAVYRNLTLDFTPAGTSVQIEFLDIGLQGVNDESWGLDNVRLALSASPSSFIFQDDFEGGASGAWTSTATDSTHLGAFSQFSGRFSNQTQTLKLTGLNAGQSYQLTFDLYILDSWEGAHPTSGPDYFDVFIDGTRRFHEAFANSILSQSLQTFGATGSAVLQIVPVITFTSALPAAGSPFEQRYVLTGSGFMEGASTVTVGGNSFEDPYPNINAHFDVSGVRNDAFLVETPLSLDGPIRVTTPGGFHEIEGFTFTPPMVVEFTGILAEATSGMPADPQIPSAHTGQLITLQGYGFDFDTLVQFEASDRTGMIGTVTRTGSPRDGGTTLTVEVPALARTGMVRVFGDDAAFPLQIVPTLRAAGGAMVPGSVLILEGTGLVEDQLSVSIDGVAAPVVSVETIFDLTDQQIVVAIVPIGITSGIIQASTGGGSTAMLEHAPPIVSQPLTPAVDVGDSMATALDLMLPINNHVDVSQTIGDGLFGNADVDLYRITANAFDVLTVSMTRLQPSNAYSSIRIFDAEGTSLTGDVANGPDLTPFIRYFLPADGTYFLGVSSALNGGYDPAVEGSGYPGDTGSYDLSVTLSRGTSLTGIPATALSGTPTAAAVASANIGQTITLNGAGFLSTDTVSFTAMTESGFLIVSTVAPLSVAPDGTSLTVIVPNAAISGMVRLSRESTGLFLQIVPTLTDVDYANGLKLIGKGFVESVTVVHFDTYVLPDTGMNSGIDVRSTGTEITLQLPAGVPLGPIRVTTPGGTSAPFNITFTDIVATAASGTPANPANASANNGQTIALQGSGFDMTTDVVFQFVDGNGVRSQRVIRPIAVNGDGTEISVVVPNEANGVFPIQIAGAAFAPLLQIVPVISTIDVTSTNAVRLSGNGFAEGATNYQFAGTLLRDLSATTGTIDVSFFGTSTVDFYPLLPGHGFGTLVATTEGGTSAPLPLNFASPHTNGVPLGYLHDVAYDTVTDRMWVVTSHSPAQVHQVDSATGATLSSFIMSSGVFGSTLLANGGIQVLVSAIPSLAGVAVPAGSLLFFNGSASPDRIVAVDSAGTLIASLALTELDIVGGAYDPATDRLYLLDGSPDQVVVVNPANGNVESTFAVPIDVSNGDIAIHPTSGNLWIASNSSTNLVEMTPAGVEVRQVSLTPLGIGFELTGLAFRNENELLASSTLGVIYVIPDPLVFMAAAARGSPGDTITVPVSIDNANYLQFVVLEIHYDTTLLDVALSDIHLGSLTSSGTLVANVDDVSGIIAVALSFPDPLGPGSGSLVEIDYHIAWDAPSVKTLLDLQYVSLNNDSLILTQAPSVGVDSVDGLISIESTRETKAKKVLKQRTAGISFDHRLVTAFDLMRRRSQKRSFHLRIHAGD